MQADARAEQTFLKRPPEICLKSMVIQKWTQLCNRRFWMDPQKIHGGGPAVEACETAEHTFLKRPPHFFKDHDHLKVDATAQQAFLEGP